MPDLKPNPSLVNALAHAFLEGEMTQESVAARAGIALGKKWRWLRPVATRYVERFGETVTPRHQQVVEFLARDRSFLRACRQRTLTVTQRITEPPEMRPAKCAASWPVPKLCSVKALADWLRLTPRELGWFADLKGLLAKQGNARLQHYFYRAIAKRSGGLRMIEAPKQHMKHIQRQILSEILERIPVHPVAHGFIKGRSIRTFVAPHAGRDVLLRMDLNDFFPSFTRARIQSLFRFCGYPEQVADLLGGLCTSVTPRGAWAKCGSGFNPQQLLEARRRYEVPHLPQGAPTSPALANICFYRIDARLHGLAKKIGATYTRYADDLAFSRDTDFGRVADRFSISAAAILFENGFQAHLRKTRILRRGARQLLAGIVVNDHPNFRRDDFDRLKATLTNCARRGAETQNHQRNPEFRAHLNGRVGFVESINPQRGERLRRIFDRIEWTTAG